ncbi:hypothetical protein BpHYR1_022742 [Brachionus plicatilis]|uniref:Uncharacterized protein n=1 Tax=Brachionus plicatilis TaxID=10195 RepID=A0A3M7PHT5_BRAPC|nr:hypothetical protein BpHYR1_022742 [Brachionus plicatilis]
MRDYDTTWRITRTFWDLNTDYESRQTDQNQTTSMVSCGPGTHQFTPEQSRTSTMSKYSTTTYGSNQAAKQRGGILKCLAGCSP